MVGQSLQRRCLEGRYSSNVFSDAGYLSIAGAVVATDTQLALASIPENAELITLRYHVTNSELLALNRLATAVLYEAITVAIPGMTNPACATYDELARVSHVAAAGT